MKGSPTLALIAAMTQDRVIGLNNRLPWQLPQELQYFREMTLGKPMIMGHRTFASMGYRPLPKRQTIIISRDPTRIYPGVRVVGSMEAALACAEPADEMMVIGGSEIYAMALPRAARVYLSIIEGHYQGDRYFPIMDLGDWDLMSEKAMDGFTAKIFDRKKNHRDA